MFTNSFVKSQDSWLLVIDNKIALSGYALFTTSLYACSLPCGIIKYICIYLFIHLIHKSIGSPIQGYTVKI